MMMMIPPIPLPRPICRLRMLPSSNPSLDRPPAHALTISSRISNAPGVALQDGPPSAGSIINSLAMPARRHSTSESGRGHRRHSLPSPRAGGSSSPPRPRSPSSAEEPIAWHFSSRVGSNSLEGKSSPGLCRSLLILLLAGWFVTGPLLGSSPRARTFSVIDAVIKNQEKKLAAIAVPMTSSQAIQWMRLVGPLMKPQIERRARPRSRS